MIEGQALGLYGRSYRRRPLQAVGRKRAWGYDHDGLCGYRTYLNLQTNPSSSFGEGLCTIFPRLMPIKICEALRDLLLPSSVENIGRQLMRSVVIQAFCGCVVAGGLACCPNSSRMQGLRAWKSSQRPL